MANNFFIKAIVIGFTVAAVVGPIGLLCVQRTLARGWKWGMASGLGVASGDALYGLIGGLGLSLVTNFLVGQQLWLRSIGGGVLIYLGVKAFVSPTALNAAEEQAPSTAGYLKAYSSIFLLTLSNPMTIIFFAGIYAGLGEIGIGSGWANAGMFALGILFGSLAWWVVLVSSVSALRSRFNPHLLSKLNRVSGVIIAGFGVWIWVSMISGR